MTERKHMDVAEFRRLGFLQEINRRLLHPCGLALEVHIDEDGTERFSGVWDARDDPDGVTYDDPGPDLQKALAVATEIGKRARARRALLGSTIQACDRPLRPRGAV